MKIERTKNAARNIVFGLILKLYSIIVPFFMRTAMIYFMGIKYLGLNSLFASVLQVLNLAELGVGSAMVFSMYKPIAEDDDVTICALMKLYRQYYRIIGAIIAVVGSALTPFIPKLIHGEIPSDINVYILYLMNLGATVLSYWLFAYKNSILNAHQRTDVISKVQLITNTLLFALQFLVLFLFKNYYLYVLASLLIQALTNIITAIVSDRLYPKFKPNGNLDKKDVAQINKRIRDLFTSKIGAVVLNSSDTIVISAFLGLTVLAVYQNYYYILTAVIGLVGVVFQSCTAGIGNSLITETKEKNFNDLKKFTFIVSWIGGVCSCCFISVFQPFMKLWMGSDNLLPFSAVICLVIYYWLYEINQLLNTYKDAGGLWRQDRFRPLITAIVNLGLNLIMVQFIGIYGVLLSTVIAFVVIGMPWLFHNLFTLLFDKSYFLGYLKKILCYLALASISSTLVRIICLNLPFTGVLEVLVCAIVGFAIPNLLFLIALHRFSEFADCIILVDNMTKGKIRLAERVGIKER